jgi:hypothetical protein
VVFIIITAATMTPMSSTKNRLIAYQGKGNELTVYGITEEME